MTVPGHPQVLRKISLSTLKELMPATLAEIEKQAILSALRASAGHHKKTGDQLGISLRTQRYLNECGQ